MFTIKIIYSSSGKPYKGARVAASFDGFFSGGITNDERTDSNGEAHFDSNPGSGKIYVDGREVFRGRIEGRMVVYV